MKNNTPQHFALQLGSLISLYVSLSFLLVLLFGLITLLFPDASEQPYVIESASSSVRLGIAMVIVAFPTYLILTRIVNRLRRTAAGDQYLTLTKWLIYLSLIIGIGSLLVDLVIVISTFLEGDITTRFICKAAAVLIVVGAAVYYYILDGRGYWLKNEDKSILFAIGASLCVLVAIIYGFANIATPAQVREQKLDAKQITDLQIIQSRIQEHLAISSSTLPTNLETAFGEFPVPTAPGDRPAYTYTITEKGFELCATFAEPMRGDMMYFTTPMPMMEKSQPIINSDDWQYKAGRFCFDRVVNKL